MDASRRLRLLHENAEPYARVALANIQREYPASVPYFITGPGPLPSPRELHPSFYGSLDWHSCVEMHWVLVRLLRVFPALTSGPEIRAALGDHLSAEKLAREAAYFTTHRAFERPYGWGWALRLAHELSEWDDRDGGRWLRNIAPLASLLRESFLAWLPKATYPQRTGLHGNSAFGLLLASDYARAEAGAGQPELRRAFVDAAKRWYENDADSAARLEPSGSDFLSPALCEAALMRDVLAEDDFARWLARFLPSLPATLLQPAEVADASDGQIAHLHGLNLSRAFCMRLIRETLAADDPRSGPLDAAITRHADASLGFVVGSDYMVEHWLAAYAVLLLS